MVVKKLIDPLIRVRDDQTAELKSTKQWDENPTKNEQIVFRSHV